ncbi:A/G-specific adenine glycosylase [hydrothermal vent metagenome]|uniref:A/G-specific adenine glycosylase n=1 Tax=hydrothermal vent metagenome TaxID=652676 RepID=A0A3B0WHL6_9ZZZZ
MKKKVFFKWLKRISLVLGIIPILLFLAFAGAVSFIDFNQYKSQIEQEITQYTGREFNIKGDVDVSVLPFEFTATDLVLKNPAGFETENLLSVQTAEVELSFWSLLWHKEVNVLRLELFEPKLHLIKTKEGDNWSDIKGFASWLKHRNVNTDVHTVQTSSEWFESLERVQVSLKPETKVNNLAQEELNKIMHWAFDSLVIRNGKIQIYDKVQGFAETFLNINILTFDVVKDQPFDISSDFIYQNSLSQRIYDVHLNSTLEIKNQFKIWQLSQWNGIFKIRLPEDQNVPEIRLTTRGERFEFDVETLQITVDNGFLSGLDAQLQSSFSGQFGLNTLLSGTVTLQQLNFKEWAKHLGLPLPKFVNQQALSEGNGQFEWHWDGTQLLLNKINVQIDDSKVQGDLSYDLEGNQSLRFELNLHALNLDFYQVYLPIKRGGEKNNAPLKRAIKQPTVSLPVPISVDFLKQVTAFGQLNLTQFTAFDVKVDTLEVEVLAEKGALQLAPLDATLYQGELLSRLHIDLAGELPSFHWKGRVNHLVLEEVAKLPFQSFVLAGTLVSRFDLKTTGEHLETIKSHLNGRFSLEVEDAKLAGIDINRILAGELDLTPSASNTPYTELQKMTLVGRWSNGVYSARKLDVISERFSVSGAGVFDLNTTNIDSTLNVLIEQPMGGVKILKGLSLPVTYRGTLHTNTPDKRAIWKINVEQMVNGTAIQKQLIQGFLNTF